MLLTVDEASKLKPLLAGIEGLEKEYRTYKNIVNVFGIWFFILTTVRALVVSTVIASLIKQEPNLLIAWEKGYGVMVFLLYLVVSCLPIIGNLVNIFAPIAVIVAAFTMGGGITSNFAPFILPMAIAYAVTFGLIFYSNYLFNSLLKHSCPELYEEIEAMSELDDTAKTLFYGPNATGQDIHQSNNTKSQKNKKNIEEGGLVDKTETHDDDYDDDAF